MTAKNNGTIVQTSYRTGGAGSLLDYMEREGSPLRDRSGNRLTDRQREQFIDKSEGHNFQRDFIISPSNRHDLTDQEIDRATRKTMREYTRDKPTADYTYAIHRDTENPHAHVAVTGERRELYMDNDDLDQLKERAGRTYSRTQRSRDRDRDRDRDRSRFYEQERERENEREQEQEQEPAVGRGW